MSCCGTGTLTKQTPLSQPVQPTYQPVLLEAAPEAIQHAKLGRPVRHIPLSLLNRRKEVHAPERECLKEPRVPPRARSRTNSTRSQELSGTSQGRREGYNGYTRLHIPRLGEAFGHLYQLGVVVDDLGFRATSRLGAELGHSIEGHVLLAGNVVDLASLARTKLMRDGERARCLAIPPPNTNLKRGLVSFEDKLNFNLMAGNLLQMQADTHTHTQTSPSPSNSDILPKLDLRSAFHRGIADTLDHEVG